MKIEQPTANSLYVTIGNFTYYFDDSIDGEYLVERWKNEDGKPETLQISDFLLTTKNPKPHLTMKIQDIIDALEADKDFEEIIMTALQCENLPNLAYFKAFIYQQITKGELLEVLQEHSVNAVNECVGA